jgi:hypothetical protein
VTAAFSDLIVKQNEIMFNSKNVQQQTKQQTTTMTKQVSAQKEPLSTKTPEDEEEDFAEFEPRFLIYN